MKKSLLITLFAFIAALLYCETDGDSDARNYLELAVSGGRSVTTAGDSAGFGVGLNLGYARRINDHLALGPGLALYGGIPNYVTVSGVAILLKCMIGDLRNRKWAVLADIGGGWLFQANLGFYYRGFEIKAGYLLTGFGVVHNFQLLAGYTIDW
jgi:hypothetical protein